MKRQINKKTENIQQYITIFTEDNWQKEKSKYNSTIHKLFSGKKSEVFINTTETSLHFLVGIGTSNLQDADLVSIASKFSFDFKDKIQAQLTKIECTCLEKKQLDSILLGLYLGTYNYPFERKHPFWNDNFNWESDSLSEKEISELQNKVFAICEGQFTGMDWLNKPANYKKVNQVNDFLKKMSKSENLKYKSFNRAECEKLGLGAFLAVNQGSSQEASFTILEYKSDVNVPTIGLVGKCVLFDTGGISIKPSTNLHYMKSDMGGATAVIGTLIAAAKMKLPVNLIAILPITDNTVSAEAYLPSDVITAYNGKTIEVLDTDAEGRMTLADGLSYLTKNYKTAAIIDVATLTGSAVRMFGNTCGALFSNNENLQKQLEKSGDNTGQRLWNLPLWEIWKEDFLSDVADYKNISSKPFGDCIVAAKFLEQFIDNHPSWAHLDIAGVAFGNVNYAKEKAATGYGVRLLIDFLLNYKN